MLVGSTLRAAGATHPGLLRDSNEDRLHYDPARGLFIVVDGVGGQAAGETAAETALRKIRERLEARDRIGRRPHPGGHHQRQQRSLPPGLAAARVEGDGLRAHRRGRWTATTW